MSVDRAAAARKAWITIRANRAKAGYVPKPRSGKPRAPARRRIKGSFKPVTYTGHGNFWATPKYQGGKPSRTVAQKRIERARVRAAKANAPTYTVKKWTPPAKTWVKGAFRPTGGLKGLSTSAVGGKRRRK